MITGMKVLDKINNPTVSDVMAANDCIACSYGNILAFMVLSLNVISIIIMMIYE